MTPARRLLAITGLLMLPRGKRQRRRALILTGVGVAVPLVFLALLY